MNKNIIKAIKKRLTEILPGSAAQNLMAPEMRKHIKPNIKANTRISAVLLLLSPYNNTLSFPLILRPTYPGVHSGQMALPGGKVEKKDLSLVHTALRETEEEIGVLVEEKQVLGKLSVLYIPPSNILVTPVVAFSNKRHTYKPEIKEVAEVFDITLDMIQDKRNINEKIIHTSENGKMKVPTYQVLGQTMWGATAMILSEFLQIYDEIYSSIRVMV